MKKILTAIYLWLRSFFIGKKQRLYITDPRRKIASQSTINYHCRNRKKEPWVIDKVLYLKAITGFGCGKVAETFNRLHGDTETVSKTYVYNALKQNRHRLLVIRRNIRKKSPKAVPINHTWGIDLTTATLNKRQFAVLGIIDHGSRMCLKLEKLQHTHSWHILNVYRRYGPSIRPTKTNKNR